MSEDKRLRETLRKQSAEWLFGSLHRGATESVEGLEAVAEHLKVQHPELAERVDWVIGQAIARAQLLPEAVTALYLMDTQEPPEIIDGEVIAVEEVEGQAIEEDASEVQDE